MEYTDIPKGKRRFWIITNLISIILFACLFQLIIALGLDLNYLFVAGTLLIITLISFYIAFGTTNLWSFTHRPFKQLDEREAQVSGNATGISYAIFTIFSLSIFVLLSALGLRVSVVLAVSLIYFAHILLLKNFQ